jgi:hypothetical protein
VNVGVAGFPSMGAVVGFPSMGMVRGGWSSTTQVAVSDGGGPEGGGVTERGCRGGMEVRKLWHSGTDTSWRPQLSPCLGSLRWARSMAVGAPLLEWWLVMGRTEGWRRDQARTLKRPGGEEAVPLRRRDATAQPAPGGWLFGGLIDFVAWRLAGWHLEN